MTLDYIPNQFGQTWVASRAEARRGVHTPLAYIDINEGNRFDADLFAQSMYRHEPISEDGQPLLTQRAGGYLWLAKNHSDWLRETRIKNRTARQCLERIKKRNLIFYEVHGREGDSTPFVRINWDEFERRMGLWLKNHRENFTEKEYDLFLELFKTEPVVIEPVVPQSSDAAPANPDIPCQGVDMPFQPPLTSHDSPLSPDVIPNTETTTKTTSETTTESHVAPVGATPSAADDPEEKTEDTSAAKPTKKEREPNPWYDVVFEVWGFTAAKNTGYANMLQGKGKAAQYKKYNVEPPLESPEKLKAWAAWYRWAKLHNETLNMLESTEGIQSSIGEWRALGEPAPTVFESTPLFDAVKLHVFGTDDANARGEQMEHITSWLAGELDGGVGKLSRSATIQQVAAFAGWYKSAFPTASLPRDLEKFANSWRAWAKSQKPAPIQQRQVAAKPRRQMSPEEFRSLQDKLKSQKQPEPVP